MMRHARTLGGIRFRGGRIEATIDLERITADDLAAQPFRDPDRELGLAGPRRT
jgi:hypothetical protein